ncbi:SAP domain-containing protein [Nocardiopsis flavescens]|uniref:SAP domain-containing protein n=1 Tax=Nocardiopsis flavescens TaxID=758803 RepID=UPI00365C0FB8
MDDLTGKTLAELRALCRERGLPVSGNRPQLIDRLTDTADSEATGPAPAPVEDEDDVFTSDDPDLVPDAVTAPEPPQDRVPVDEALADSDPEPVSQDDDATSPALEQQGEEEREPAEPPSVGGLRSRLLTVFALPDTATDGEVLDAIGRRVENAYQQGRCELADEAAREVVATTGRGGTLSKRIAALAHRGRGAGANL